MTEKELDERAKRPALNGAAKTDAEIAADLKGAILVGLKAIKVF